MPRDIERDDGTKSHHIKDKNGDHRVRDYGTDGGKDRHYGYGHSDREVREKEKDSQPEKP